MTLDELLLRFNYAYLDLNDGTIWVIDRERRRWEVGPNTFHQLSNYNDHNRKGWFAFLVENPLYDIFMRNLEHMRFNDALAMSGYAMLPHSNGTTTIANGKGNFWHINEAGIHVCDSPSERASWQSFTDLHEHYDRFMKYILSTNICESEETNWIDVLKAVEVLRRNLEERCQAVVSTNFIDPTFPEKLNNLNDIVTKIKKVFP